MSWVVNAFVLATEISGPGGAIDGPHARVGALVLERDRDRTGPRADVDDDRLGPIANDLERGLDDDLGLGSGHEHTRTNHQLEVPEAGHARQVLGGHPRAAPAERPAERLGLVAAQRRLTRVQPGSVSAEDAGEELLGRGHRGLHVVPLQVVGRSPQHLGGSHTSSPADPSASWWARSAALSRSTNASSSSPPAKTSASWCDVCLMR